MALPPYVMALRHRGCRMDRVTRRCGVAQALASANARPWLLANAELGLEVARR